MLETSLNETMLEIVKLKKQYLFSSSELNRLTEVLLEKVCEYDTLSNKLRSYEKEHVITAKKYQAAKNKIAILRKKIPLMGDSLNEIQRELLDSEKTVARLKGVKLKLMGKISQIEQKTASVTKILSTEEADNSELLSDIEKAEAEKTILLNEISEQLLEVSDEKVRSDRDLEDFSMDFAKIAGERELLLVQFDENKKQLAHSIETSRQLEEEHSSLADIVKFEKQLNNLQPAVESLEKNAEKEHEEISMLKNELQETKEDLNALEIKNVSTEEKISALEEEVKMYDALMLKLREKENILRQSDELIEKSYADINELFAENIKLEQGLNLAALGT